MGVTRKIIRATREVTVDINGEKYHVLVIPDQPNVEVDYSEFPEGDPLRRKENVKTFQTVDLDYGQDLVIGESPTYRLTKEGAEKLLSSL